MKLKLKLVILLGLAMIIGGPVSAYAGPIDGTFSLYALFKPVNGQTGAVTNLGDATGINFLNLNLSDTTGSGEFLVTTASDDFAWALLFPVGRIKDFTFEGTGSAGFPTAPLANFELLLGNMLSFHLDSINVADQNSNVLHLVGSGVFNWAGGGFDPTPGTFDFFGTSGGGSFSFNTATAAAPVPEPSSLILLGSGAAAAIARFRRRRQTVVA